MTTTTPVFEPPGPELALAIREDHARDRSRMTMMTARAHGVPEQAVVEVLRRDGWPIHRLRDGVFRDLMEGLPKLGPLRVFVRSRGAVIESVGQFGGYSETGPFFNVQTETLDMHILPDEVAAIYAVQKHGHDTDFVTHSFQFFDRHGDAAFKTFLWEDFPKVPEARITAFHELVGRLADDTV